jgi:hypothetical protein
LPPITSVLALVYTHILAQSTWVFQGLPRGQTTIIKLKVRTQRTPTPETLYQLDGLRLYPAAGRGALLTFLLMCEVGPAVQRDRHAKLDGTQAWAAFLFVRYLFGHLDDLLDSWLGEFDEEYL